MIKDYKEEVFNFKNKNNHTIHATYSYVDKNAPLIIISPPYEKTIRNTLVPMVYLINNGFNVFRFDNTFHEGNSYGEFVNYTLSSALDDTISVVDFINSEESIVTEGGLSLMGISISARTAYRYLRLYPEMVDSFLGIVGVIDMQYTLKAITEIDLVQSKLDSPPKMWGVKKVLHFPIDYDNFLDDCIGADMHNLESTIDDVEKLCTPISLIVGEDDKWVNINDYEKIFGNYKHTYKISKIPGAGHEIYKNPESAKYAFYETVKIFSKFYFNKEVKTEDIMKPTITEIIKVNKKERMREEEYRYVIDEK